MDKFIKIQKR